MKHNYIVYDLETSGLNFVDQILTFSFKQIDNFFNVIDTCEGSIKINHLQLPSPGAILANQIDVLEHQKTAQYSEPQAMKLIHHWIRSKTEQNKTFLMGKNSYKFDLPFLRTSMIRNGLNPYFGGHVINRDLQFVIFETFIKNIKFRQTLLQGDSFSNTSYRKLFSLENVAQKIGVLRGKQSHDASEDVDLTIEVMKKIQVYWHGIPNTINRRGFPTIQSDNIIEWEPYQNASQIEKNKNLGVKISFNQVENIPQFEFLFPYQQKNSNALWINLTRIAREYDPEKDIREYINWFNRKDGYVCILDESEIDSCLFDLSKCFPKKVPNTKEKLIVSQFAEHIAKGVICDKSILAIKQFGMELAEYISEEKNINVDNFFEERNCDIEQHIYRLPFNAIDVLTQAIWENKYAALKESNNKEVKELYQRFFLNYVKPERIKSMSSEQKEKYDKALKNYAQYRYGKLGCLCSDDDNNKDVSPAIGWEWVYIDDSDFEENKVEKNSHPQRKQMKINKFNTKHHNSFQEGANPEDFHNTLDNLQNSIKVLKKHSKTTKDALLIQSLEKFYSESIMVKVLNDIEGVI
jgi:hypothetical protein